MGKGNVFTHVCHSVHRGVVWSVAGVFGGGVPGQRGYVGVWSEAEGEGGCLVR